VGAGGPAAGLLHWDDAVAESFFSTLEHELLAGADLRSRAGARQAIFRYIEVRYNRRR
jgi:putative transposase